jgi:hypothetical protein
MDIVKCYVWYDCQTKRIMFPQVVAIHEKDYDYTMTMRIIYFVSLVFSGVIGTILVITVDWSWIFCARKPDRLTH